MIDEPDSSASARVYSARYKIGSVLETCSPEGGRTLLGGHLERNKASAAIEVNQFLVGIIKIRLCVGTCGTADQCQRGDVWAATIFVP